MLTLFLAPTFISTALKILVYACFFIAEPMWSESYKQATILISKNRNTKPQAVTQCTTTNGNKYVI